MADGIYFNPQTQLVVDTVGADNISQSSESFVSYSYSATKAGYQAIGLVGCGVANGSNSGANATRCVIYDAHYNASDDKVWVYIRNNSTSTAKIKITAYVLYQKV